MKGGEAAVFGNSSLLRYGQLVAYLSTEVDCKLCPSETQFDLDCIPRTGRSLKEGILLSFALCTALHKGSVLRASSSVWAN
jgi:hypothetical protein